MLNDIFATSIAGEYVKRRGEGVVERGTWSYRGHGNAEITMEARGETPGDSNGYSILIHSSERQLNHVLTTFGAIGAEEGEQQRFEAEIAGYLVRLKRAGSSHSDVTLNVPDETIYDGTSPIWLIHLMMIALPPEDREVVAPVIFFDAAAGMVQGGFYRFSRTGLRVGITVIDQEGTAGEEMVLELTEDAIPQSIRSGDTVTEITCIPRPVVP